MIKQKPQGSSVKELPCGFLEETELPSGNVPTTQVRRRFFRFSRTITLLVRVRDQRSLVESHSKSAFPQCRPQLSWWLSFGSYLGSHRFITSAAHKTARQLRRRSIPSTVILRAAAALQGAICGRALPPYSPGSIHRSALAHFLVERYNLLRQRLLSPFSMVRG